MRGRDYTRKIEIWQRGQVEDGFGGFTPEEVKIREVWTAISTKGAGYKFQQFGLNDFKNPVIFRVRGGLVFDENTFVIYKGIKYIIKGTENVDLEGREINIYCDSV